MRRLVVLSWIAAMSGCATAPPPRDVLFESFVSPPMVAHPFVRWWWNGARVNEVEIRRELDVMKAAGIGGVEINTIGMPEAVSEVEVGAFPARPWLSDSWNAAVKAATDGARERGMTADLIVGSGWPFGGRFLAPNEQIERVRLATKDVAGPAVLVYGPGQLEQELFEPQPGQRRRGRPSDEPLTERSLVFLRLVPAKHDKTAAFSPGTDLFPRVRADGSVEINVPAGAHRLLLGFREIGFSHVKLGAPGADGPVVDHFNAAAVRHYLDHMSNTLAPSLGGALGPAVRAMFVDSLELDGANWTIDLPDEFARRHGYALAPYLPFVLERDDAKDDSPFADTVRRARFDFLRTLVDLFHERFLRTYVDWCHANKVLARIQAYGREAHPLDASMTVDLPEGETWLWADQERMRFETTVVDRYVGSAARLAGKPLVSFEAMTNAGPVFRETLDDFKVALDWSLLAGVNHPIVHGFNYSPPEAGFPGWIRFGDYLNEKNPWWPYFPRWTTYAARLSAVLRQVTATSQIAVLAPRADEWAHEGLLYQPFPETKRPWYQYQLADALASNGAAVDFVSAAVLAGARAEAGHLVFGPRSYDALVLEDVASLEPDAARTVAAFARAGGTVIFVGQTPARAPSLQDAANADAGVQAASSAALAANKQRVALVPGPAKDKDDLVAWTRALLARFAIAPDIALSQPRADVQVVHYRSNPRDLVTRDLVLFSNINRVSAAVFDAALPAPGAAAFVWDPETGARAPFARDARGHATIDLGPEESLLLVFEAPTPAKAPAAPSAGPAASSAEAIVTRPRTAPGDSQIITGPWTLDLVHIDPKKSAMRTMATLVDLGRSDDDPVLFTFAGRATYHTDVVVTDPKLTVLDLGEVNGVSEVTVNGVALGVRWYGRHTYDAARALHAGTNRLDVSVTTMPANYVKSLRDENAMAKRWAGWFPKIPAGLVGPVRLALPASADR